MYYLKDYISIAEPDREAKTNNFQQLRQLFYKLKNSSKQKAKGNTS